jgi:hypothetical protein
MLDSLAEDAIALVGNKSRAILGIAGSPGVGKSTLVEQLLVGIRAIMGEQWAAHVPMDGFHLADVQLERLGVRDRQGPPETFDADGYAHLLLSTTAVKAERIIVRRCRAIRQRVKRGPYRMLQPVSPLWQCSPPPQGLQRQPQLTTAWGCSMCTGAACSQSGLSTWSGRRCRPPMVCLLWLWSPRAKVWSSIAADFKTIPQFID